MTAKRTSGGAGARAAAALFAASMALAAGAGASVASPVGPEMDPYRSFVTTASARALLAAARETMRGYWGEPAVTAADDPGAVARTAAADSIPWPGPPASVYLSLVGDDGTRACVGGPPAEGGLAGTVRSLARRVLHSDPRRPPVRQEELERLRIVISFAGAGAPISDPMEWDPGKEGLLVRAGARSVAFLPGEARTVSWALREARRIGVLAGPPSSASYQRCPVVVLMESPVSGVHREESHAAP
jgi:hypothetical protein